MARRTAVGIAHGQSMSWCGLVSAWPKRCASIGLSMRVDDDRRPRAFSSPRRQTASAARRRSMMPWKRLPWPTGQVRGAPPSCRRGLARSSSISASGSCTSRVHLVDEGEDRACRGRGRPRSGDSLRLDAIAGVDHHQRRVDGGEHAIGVPKSWRPGVSSRLIRSRGTHLHHRRRTEMPRCFDLHPVRCGVRLGLRAFTEPAIWIAPRTAANFSVSVVLPASGGDDGEGAPAAHPGSDVDMRARRRTRATGQGGEARDYPRRRGRADLRPTRPGTSAHRDDPDRYRARSRKVVVGTNAVDLGHVAEAPHDTRPTVGGCR